jgi:hypothetical protein
MSKFLSYIKKNIYLIIGVIIVGLTSFHYALLYNFPIGHDVINHIANIRNIDEFGLRQLFAHGSLYPIPTFIFYGFDKILGFFGLPTTRTFMVVECLFLFATALLVWRLTKKIFRDNMVGFISAVLVASSRWLNDSMRIGLMAEMLGWVMFVICLELLIEKKWLALIISIFIFAFVHPLPLGVFLVVALLYAVYWMIFNPEGERKPVIFVLLALAVLGGLALVVFKEKADYIKTILQMNFQVEGERSLLNFITDASRPRVIEYLLALGAFVALLFRRKTNKEVLFLILVVASLLICFKQWLGIHFLGFRYYTYFEISASILAAVGTVMVANRLSPRLRIPALSLALAFMFIANMHANLKLDSWMLDNPSLMNATPVAERTDISRAASYVTAGSNIYGRTIWVNWFKNFDDQPVGPYGGWDTLISSNQEIKAFRDDLAARSSDYVYFSSMEARQDVEKKDFLRSVYDANGIRIYQIDKVKLATN